MLFFDTIGIFVAMFIPFILFSILSYIGYVPEFLRTAQIATFASAFWLLIVWCALAVQWTDYYLDIWVITNTRIISISQIDLFNRTISNWGVERIQEVTVHSENIIQTFFNYGTLQIQTAGPADEYGTAVGIPNPERVRTVIMAQINHIGKLEQINQEQESLLYTVSHDVKGYLSKDAAALAAISEDPATTRSLKDIAQRALAETRSGVAALMHLLSLPRDPAVVIKPTNAVVDLKPMIAELVDDYQSEAKKKNVVLQFSSGNSPCMVAGDTIALRDLVFKNLIDNALRYTPGGTVALSLASDGRVIHFSVEDSGVGIVPQDMEKLFTPGGHGEHSRDINPESTGYGLSSAKDTVTAHGGKIWAKSAGLDHGTTFFVELPAARFESIV